MTGVRSSEQTTPAATVQVTRVVVNGVVRAGSDASTSAAMNQGAPSAEADVGATNHDAGANIAITAAPAVAASDATGAGAGDGDVSEEHAPAAAADGSGSGSPDTVVATSGVDATMQATADADGAIPASAPEHADASVEQCGTPGGPVATADSAVNAGV